MVDVAVTGMAWTTALGNNLEEVWSCLKKGDSGFSSVSSSYQLRNNLAASVMPLNENLSPSEHLNAITSDTIRRALNDAGIENQSGKIMLIVGTSFGARLDDEKISQKPLHQWVDNIASQQGLSSLALSTACSSASDAILTGAALIKSGYVDICICGGADILGDSKRLAHSGLGTMSPTSLRSFDKHRDGTLLGEGAGFLVLEKFSSLRNKKPYAFLSGCGSANDASGLTAPDEEGNGISLAINRSLRDAEIEISQVSLVSAHASGTLTNDQVEIKAYKNIFAHLRPLIFATKGAFGHSLGATGVLEAIALILALRDQTVPPINNLTSPLEHELLQFPVATPVSHDATFGLSLTIGFGGFNTSLIFERVE
jgi:3-oxoacyl-[acyl-carrier-protein] synthase II